MNMEDWKDDIINSLKGAEKAKPSANAFSKIQEKIAKQTPNKPGTKTEWWAVAATISLIVMANVYFLLSYSSTESNKADEMYSGIVSNYNLYENDK